MPAQLSKRSGHGSPARCGVFVGEDAWLHRAADIEGLLDETSLTDNAVGAAAKACSCVNSPLEGADSGYNQAALPASLA
jgi:hypothetical protein